MAEAPDTVWMYTPSFPLAVLASVLYGLVFIWIFYLTVIKYRAWYFTCVVIGAAIEVAGYAMRCYSIKNPSQIVRAPLPRITSNPSNLLAGPLCFNPFPHRSRTRLCRCWKLPPHRPPDPRRPLPVNRPSRVWSSWPKDHTHFRHLRHHLLLCSMWWLRSRKLSRMGWENG